MRSFYGVLLLIISAVTYATLPIFTRLAYDLSITLETFLFYRFFFSFILVVIYAAAKRISIPRGNTFFILFLLGALGYSGQAFLYLSAVKYASTGLVAILLYLYPAFVALIAILVYKDKIRKSTLLGLLLAFIGTVLVVEPGGGLPLGFILAISAALVYSVYITVNARYLKDVSGIRSIVVIFGAAALVYTVQFLIKGPVFDLSVQGWLAIWACVLISTIIPSITFLEGLKRVEAVQASLLSTMEPLVTVILAFILFNEALSLRATIGGGLIILTVVMLNVLKLRRMRQKTADQM